MDPTRISTDEAVHASATEGVITTARLRALGLPARAIAARCRPGGPWRRLFPRVVLLSDQHPTRTQLVRAAAWYAGEDVTVTGTDALRAHGLAVPTAGHVHLLVPTYRRMPPTELVVSERTTRMPDAVPRGGLPVAPVPRATVDAARKQPELDQLRRVLTLPIQQGMCTRGELRTELDAGNQRGSAAVRAALAELITVRPLPMHAAAGPLIRQAGLPGPKWNVTVHHLDRRPIGHVDAWWDDVALAWQLTDQRDDTVHLRLTAAGVLVVATRAACLRDTPRQVLRQLVGAFASATRRKRPHVHALSGSVAA